MGKAKIIFIAFIVVVLSQCYGRVTAQQEVKNNTDRAGLISRIIYNESVAVKFDYFGELVLHPGLSLGIDYTLARKNWVSIHWDSEMGGYWHKWNNTALFLKTSIGGRFPIRSLFVDLNLGAGYMHSFAAGTIYQKSSEGGVEKAANWGHPHFMPTSSLLIGWDGTRKMKLPWTFHIGAEAYLQSSFNHIFLPHAAVKVGFTYKFKN
jgi:hypothetical protein